MYNEIRKICIILNSAFEFRYTFRQRERAYLESTLFNPEKRKALMGPTTSSPKLNVIRFKH